MNAFARVEALYEQFGTEEPFYAVLTNDEYKRDNLDVDQFYRTGDEHIDSQMQAIAAADLHVDRRRALDFGCGVGRLTNALGRYFNEVTGVDISSTMVANAEKLRRSDNCQFKVNKRQDLSLFADNHFSFVYSDITIQHIPAPASENYIRDFMRILSPGGLTIFFVPDGPLLPNGSVRARIDKFYREQVRPFNKRIRGKRQVQTHPLARGRVEQLIVEGGGKLVKAEPHPYWANRSKKYKPLYYWATK